MNPSKKLYQVNIGAIEDGDEYANYDSKTVVAEDALKAAKRIRLVKTARKQTFISSIHKISDIDKV